MAALLRRDVSFSSVTMETGLHQAAALAAMTLLFTAHRSIVNIGFTNRRRGLSTDTYIVLIIGLVVFTWTALVIGSGVLLGDRPCLQSFRQCGARLAYVPWIMIILFIFWLIAYGDMALHLRSKDSLISSNDESDKTNEASLPAPTTNPKPTHNKLLNLHLPRYGHWGIWKMECSHGPTNWSGSLNPWFRWTLYLTILSVCMTVSIAALMESLYTIGLLTTVGVVLFMTGASGKNDYATAPHLYTRDTLRVMLHTRHRMGTAYILPCRDRGFDAVWGPKIEYENRALDKAQEQFVKEGGYGKKRTHISMDSLLSWFNNAAAGLEDEDIIDLAEWLYTPEHKPVMCRLAPSCKRQAGIHLLNYSLMGALVHAEYIVFQNLDMIQKKRLGLARLAATLRSSRGTGLQLDGGVKQIGEPKNGEKKEFAEGYREAVKYVYRLFGMEAEDMALYPKSVCPQRSIVFEDAELPKTIGEYVGKLWEYCIGREESTLAALHAFTLFYQADIGNDPPNGWHGFPLLVKDREGDMVTWQIIWRQAWYGAIISQITSMSPIIFSAFVAGVLQ
ncbi:hypothetical protein B0H67DRAFT_595665 [Lasiosphaeris hirsuta]|uniref:Uncharacterized protein n=1 Tax=Lasiosphaeris hirsuta TaxID=260670 RepID=A0AA40DFK9_9PEZI|nr:hypothetical protein B0H67DRAFT_595665 [Lasiosphaeris hirsuta]